MLAGWFGWLCIGIHLSIAAICVEMNVHGASMGTGSLLYTTIHSQAVQTHTWSTLHRIIVVYHYDRVLCKPSKRNADRVTTMSFYVACVAVSQQQYYATLCYAVHIPTHIFVVVWACVRHFVRYTCRVDGYVCVVFHMFHFSFFNSLLLHLLCSSYIFRFELQLDFNVLPIPTYSIAI